MPRASAPPTSPSPRRWRSTLCGLVVLFVLTSAAPTSGNHAQTDSGRIIVFDHVAGNEWWVEVALAGQDAGSAASVEAQDTGGAWTPLAKKSWGPYAASFHLETGNQVRFRASWAGGAQQVSCWFSHPAGTEQCAAPPPPPPPPGSWQTAAIGENRPYGYGGDMALSDVDNDGRADVIVGRSTGLHTFEWTGTSSGGSSTAPPLWIQETLSTRLFDTVAAGDGDNDGTREVYGMAVGSPGLDLVQYRKTTAGWQQTTLASFTEPVAGDMTLGDIDGQPGREIYVGVFATECDPDPNVPLCSSTTTIYLVKTSVDWWNKTTIATLSGRIDSMWIGDGDNNGRFELYVGHGTRHADRTSQVQFVEGQWVVTNFSGSGSGGGFSLVVVGDGDRDGLNEVYQVNYEGVFLKHSYSQVNGWTYETMFGFEGLDELESASSLFIGDADSDGTQELYLTTELGALYQIRWSGTAWVATRIASPDDPFGRGKGSNGLLVVGDADGDGRREAFITFAFVMPNTGEDGVDRTYKVSLPPITFDATFTGVRGNEWWEQSTVTATGGTLSKVDVRLNGGAWQPLTKQSWGGYAASYRAVQGTIVQFRATATSGSTDVSDCYRWIPASNTDATKVTCGTTPPPPPGFDATFSGVQGNAWWVQVNVAGNQAIAKVEARVNCGATWQTLPLQNWGGYAKSFQVPNGAQVDFRATSTGGATDGSGGYIWPQASPTGACA